MKYNAKNGDTLDYIAYKYYRTTENGTVEALLSANPHLVHKAILNAGDKVNLPEIVQPKVKKGVRLWG